MPKSKLGIKQTCLDCGAKFFDLGRNPPECPKCGAILDDPVTKNTLPIGTTPPLAGEPAPENIPDHDDVEGGDLDGVEDVEDKEILVDDEDDDTLIEDASDLGRDADDISEVMEHIDEAVEDTT